MAGRRILLVEDDRWIADVLEQIVASAAPGSQVDWREDVFSAKLAFDGGDYDLLICDWNLPGQPGIDLVDHVRERFPDLPVIMVTGRSDRASVLAAKSHGADAFIIKPFQVDRVLATIRRYLEEEPVAGESAGGVAPDPLEYLEALPDQALEVAGLQGMRQGIDLLGENEAPDLRELAKQWEQEPALCARLLAMSNAAAYNPHGRVCSSLAEALMRLGWRTSVNVATSMAMRRATELTDPRLTRRAQQQMELAEDVSERVHELAHRGRMDPSAFHTAALLHRLGETTVILHLQEFQNRHGAIADEAVIDEAIRRFARGFADRLKSLWRLPMPVRELIGAIYALPPATTRPEKFLMRVAGNQVYRTLSDDEEARLRRLAGL